MKNTDTARSKGDDARKKVSGIKRHIGVDAQRLPPAIAVTSAEVTDRTGARQAMQRCKDSPGTRQGESMLTDSGYVGQSFAQGVRETLCETVTVQIAKRSALRKFAVIPRSFTWLLIRYK